LEVSAACSAAYSETLRAWSASACVCCCSSWSCRIRASTFWAWIWLSFSRWILVRPLAVALHRLGDGAQALGVEDVVLVELLDRHHREGRDGHVLEREPVLLQLLGERRLDVLRELLALAVQRHDLPPRLTPR